MMSRWPYFCSKTRVTFFIYSILCCCSIFAYSPTRLANWHQSAFLPRFSGQQQRKQRQIFPTLHRSKPNGNNISLICNFEKDQCSIELNRARRKGSVTGHYSHILNSQNPARKFGTCAITRLYFFKTFYL